LASRGGGGWKEPIVLWVGKAATFERCLFPNGSKGRSIFGWLQSDFRPEDCSDLFAGPATLG